MALVELLKSQTSQNQLLMHLLRCLAFYAAYFRLIFSFMQPTCQVFRIQQLTHVLLFTSLVPQSQQVLTPITNFGSASPQQARLMFSRLDKPLFDRGIFPATRAVHDSGWQWYIKLCIYIQSEVILLPAM